MDRLQIRAKLKIRSNSNLDTINTLIQYNDSKKGDFKDEFDLIEQCYDVSNQAAHIIWDLIMRFRATEEYIKRVIEADKDPSFDWQTVIDNVY